jgi:parvulin-like peptidyl-prolyl isomerase
MTGTVVLLCASAGAFAQIAHLEGNKPAATVNGEVITMAELESLIKQDGPAPVPLPETVRKQQQQVVLAALIDKVLLRQFLKSNASPIDPKELDNRLHDLVAGLQREGKTFTDFCRERNQTPNQVKEDIATVLQWREYASARITDEQVLKFYQDNKDMFDQVQVHAAEIMFHVPSQSSPAEREQAKVRLAQLREKIVNKELDFALAAKQYSQGWTKDQGGDLDWFPHLKGKGILPEAVLEAAFSPQLQPGQISDIIVSEDGVHILKVIERKAGPPSDFAKYKDIARQLCIEEMQQTVLQSLRQSAKIENHLPK